MSKDTEDIKNYGRIAIDEDGRTIMEGLRLDSLKTLTISKESRIHNSIFGDVVIHVSGKPDERILDGCRFENITIIGGSDE